MFAYCGNNPVLYVDYSGKMTDVLIEEGIELLQQLMFWWESGGREAVMETGKAFGTLIVLIIVGDVASEALDAAIVDSKTKTAGGGQAQTTPSTSTPASPNNGNNNKNNKKQSRRSEKEKASDKPSWVDQYRDSIDRNLSPQQNAKQLMDLHFGEGNWADRFREYSKIVKWLAREYFYYTK